MTDRPTRKELRLKAYDYFDAGAYFVTGCTHVRGEPTLCSLEAVRGGLCAAPVSRLTAVGELVDRAIRDIPRLYDGVDVDIYCVMPDHVRMIVTLAAGRDGARPLPDIIGRFKSYTDHLWREMGIPSGPKLWQRGYYEHVIRNEADLSETRQYIENNPRQYILNTGG